MVRKLSYDRPKEILQEILEKCGNEPNTMFDQPSGGFLNLLDLREKLDYVHDKGP